jgi:hypothetical protein
MLVGRFIEVRKRAKPRDTSVKRLFLSSVAALFLATGVAHAEVPHCKDVPPGTPCWRESTAEELKAILNKPSYAYAEKDYMIDCQSYKWKERAFHLKRGDACVFRNCRSNPPEICAGGNWGPVPRKLLRQQIRDLGRVPRERYVKDVSK